MRRTTEIDVGNPEFGGCRGAARAHGAHPAVILVSLAVMWAGLLSDSAAGQSTPAQTPPAAAPQPAPPPSEPAESLPPAEADEVEEDENYEYSPGETPESPLSEIDEAASVRQGMIDVPGLTPAVEFMRAWLDDLHSETGLRIAVAYTTLFQQATGSGGDRTAFSGDLDIMTDWTLVGRGTPNVGRLITTVEYRHQIGWYPPQFLADEIGTLQRTTGGFNDRGWAVRDLHYTQRLFDDRLRLLFGRSDVSDYVGGHRMQSINNSFSNRAFSGDSTTAYPAGHVTSAGASFRPIDEFYVTGGAANAYGTSTTNDLEFIDEGKFFGFGEIGFTPEIDELGWGRYALLIWHMPARDLLSLPSDSGFTVIGEQDLGERLQMFARYGWADDGALTGIKQSGQIGMGYRGLLGSALNMTGAAFGVSEPTADGLDTEKVFEVFHRFQLTDHSQFSIGFQSIFDPSRAPDDDFVGVLTLRFRIAF